MAPGSESPAPRVAAISSPQPHTTVVDGGRPVSAANAAVISPTGSSAPTTGGSRAGSMPKAASRRSSHAPVSGSSAIVDDAFERSTASASQATRTM